MNAWAVHGRDRLDILQRTLAPAKAFGSDAPGRQSGYVSEDFGGSPAHLSSSSSLQALSSRGVIDNASNHVRLSIT